MCEQSRYSEEGCECMLSRKAVHNPGMCKSRGMRSIALFPLDESSTFCPRTDLAGCLARLETWHGATAICLHQMTHHELRNVPRHSPSDVLGHVYTLRHWSHRDLRSTTHHSSSKQASGGSNTCAASGIGARPCILRRRHIQRGSFEACHRYLPCHDYYATFSCYLHMLTSSSSIQTSTSKDQPRVSTILARHPRLFRQSKPCLPASLPCMPVPAGKPPCNALISLCPAYVSPFAAAFSDAHPHLFMQSYNLTSILHLPRGAGALVLLSWTEYAFQPKPRCIDR